MEPENYAQATEQDIQKFELSLLFSGSKDPATAFIRLSEVFRFLHDYDQWILDSVSKGVTVEYSITNIEYSSIKSWLAQVLKAIPDDAIS